MKTIAISTVISVLIICYVFDKNFSDYIDIIRIQNNINLQKMMIDNGIRHCEGGVNRIDCKQ